MYYLHAFTRLPPSKKNPRPIAVFDMETSDGTLLGPIAGIAFTSDDDYPILHRFSSMLDFLHHFLRNSYRGFIAYAHKGMSFDIAHLLANDDVQQWLLGNGFSVSVERSFAIVRKHGNTWYLGDSLRVFNEKLEKVLASFAPHRTKAPLPKEPFSWHHPGWIARIEQDTLGLYESLKRIEKIVQDTFGVHLAITTPATSLRAARIMFPLDSVERPPNIALDWIRAGAYSGGRIEIFYQGNVYGELYCFDVNSAYAYAMKGEFPLGTGRYKKGEPKDGSEFYIGRCELDVGIDETIPPVLSRLFNHAFCVGKFQAMLTKEEVLLARECGATVRVKECWAWKKTFPVFREFILKCEQLRKQDYAGPLGVVVKLMQNGLYGILGMNPFRRSQAISPVPLPLPWLDAFDHQHGVYIPNTYETMLRKESPNQMPHWAALITARVRVQLTRYLRLCEQAGLKPLYAHTDSIWVQSKNGIPSNIRELISEEYGALKLEREGKRAIIVAPGEAAIHQRDNAWHVASKGWKATRQNEHGEWIDVSPEIFEHGMEVELEQVQVHRAGTALKSHRVGRIIRKRILNYAAMHNRLPARWIPGPTIPKIAGPFEYESYWAFKNWYVGKLLKERPRAADHLLHGAPPFGTLEVTLRKERIARRGGNSHGKR